MEVVEAVRRTSPVGLAEVVETSREDCDGKRLWSTVGPTRRWRRACTEWSRCRIWHLRGGPRRRSSRRS